MVVWMLGFALGADGPPPEDAFLDLQTRLHGYGEIGLDVKTESHPVGFDVGDAIISYETALGQRVRMQSDFVFGLGHHGEWLAMIDQLRIELQPLNSEGLLIRAGKLYLPVGFWNTNIPYGGLLYVTPSRPMMLQFERHGAAIPVHQSGVDLHGRVFAGAWKLGSHLGLGNGRSGNLNETQDIGDGGPEKATWLQVYVESPGGVQVGLSGYYDPKVQVTRQAHDFSQQHGEQAPEDIAPHAHNGQILLQEDTMEALGAAHLAWQGGRTEVLVEGMVVLHQRWEERGSLETQPLVYNLDGYAQVSHAIQRTTPFLRLDYVEYFYDDPLYQDLGRLRVTGQVAVGARADVADYAALKLQGLFQRDVIFPLALGGVEARERLGVGATLVAGF